MQKSRFISVFLCVTLLFLSVFVPPAAAATQGEITGDGVRIRSEASTKSSEIGKLNKGDVVTINGTAEGEEAVSGSGTTWYNVTYNGNTGYVYGKYVKEVSAAAYDQNFEANLLNFPQSYHAALREIHNLYPNWIFKADPVDISLDAAINSEYSESNMLATKKWVELTYGIEWRDPREATVNKGNSIESGWTFASKSAIAFFMDPRNGLKVSAQKPSFPNIFTFMEQSYDSNTQTVDGLRTIVKGTFLEKGYDGKADAYINDIMYAAKSSGVSPYIIAATIITEQGVSGTSSLISGTYPGYEGYYNFFNFGANGTDVVVNGLEYAKNAGWNSRAASISGGASRFGAGYVGTGQDTYYYMDFNVHGNCNHQYASSLYDQCVKAYFARGAYISNPQGALTFRIPVYNGIPDTVYAAPTIENYNPQPVPSYTPETSRRVGDYDGDGQVTVKELATIRMYLLGVKALSAQECSYLDVTGEGEITVKDLATVRMYLLGLVSI